MDCFVASLLAMTTKMNTASRSRCALRPSFALTSRLLDQRAQGMPGARSLACKSRKHASKSPRSRRVARHSPRNGFNSCFALSPVTGLSCHRRQWSYLHQLDASVGASGPHDFAVRKSALSSGAHLASTASRPASVTIASRPSVGRDGMGYAGDLRQKGMEIFLRRGLDR
jgi:hypothetical protein